MFTIFLNLLIQGSMPWPSTRVLGSKSKIASLSILLFYQSFICSISQSAHLTTRQVVSFPTIGKRDGLDTTPQGPSHYVTNTYLRSDLRENQKGTPLILQITVVDSQTCAPVENALVEIWGPNSIGQYSAELNGINSSKSECTSWLRGGFATDIDGKATFHTIYPGALPQRAPHLNAIIRSDWYEFAGNSTVASDSAQSVTAVGRIFFPNYLNRNVFKNVNYMNSLTNLTKNEADPSFKAPNSSWTVESQPSKGDTDDAIRVQLTIPIDLGAPLKYHVCSVATQCSTKSHNVTNDPIPPHVPSDPDQPSSASSFQPSTYVIIMINMMLIYNLYGRDSTQHREKQPQKQRFLYEPEKLVS